ncbi:FixH family protein [Gallaecimonas sp. GXIMD4217]|uniref:FixH family protein n=1 Tax=Gallaecimonas sp. GXIMD4217 TaxID=3131927 RepID=UPI00311AC56B
MQPWYKQFWPWFLIALPLSAVIAGIATVIIANNNKVSMVVDDYYKEGKAINLELDKRNAALKRGIKASLVASDKDVVLTFTGGDVAPGTPVRLSFHHATLEHKDFAKLLTADAKGHYRLALSEPLSGRWAIRAEPFDGSWRIQAKAGFPVASVELNGRP